MQPQNEESENLMTVLVNERLSPRQLRMNVEERHSLVVKRTFGIPACTLQRVSRVRVSVPIRPGFSV